MELSLFSVSYAGLWGQARLSVGEFVERAAELGFQRVMLMGKRPHLSPLDWNDERLDELAANLRRYRIGCGVLAAYTDLAPTTAAEIPYLELQLAYVESLCRMARRLDCPIVRVFTAYEAPGQAPHATWMGVVAALREMCDRAAEQGVTLAVQNHHDIAVHSEALLELLADIDRPNCRLGFDAWSPALRGEPLYDMARRLAPHTAITTNADYVRFPRYHYQPALVNYLPVAPDQVRAVRFGEGFIDYEAFFAGLADGGFDGIANYEICSPLRGGGALENLDGAARAYVEWLRAWRGTRRPS